MQNDMMIAIPSRGRSHTILGPRDALRCLADPLMDHTYIFNHYSDGDEYIHEEMLNKIHDLRHIIPLGYWSIGEKRRQMAVEAKKLGYKKIMMIDDDVNLLVRRADDNWQLRYTEDDETIEMYNYVSMFLERYAQVSLGAREGNNRLGLGGPDIIIENYRGMRANAFNVDEFLSLEHGRVAVMEDFDITLQLLRRRRKTAVTVYWATGQKATNTEGGCSLWRTHELHEQSVYKLMELHPGLVRARWKENKGGGEFGKRVEATISWKQAYDMGDLA